MFIKIFINAAWSAIIFITLLLAIGYVVDSVSYIPLKHMGNQALSDLKTNIRREDNAWDFYVQFSDRIKERTFNKDIEDYIRGDIAPTSALEKIIKENQDIFHLLREGTKLANCSSPLDYEKGCEHSLPDYLSLQKVGRLIAARSLLNFENNRLDEGFMDLTMGLTFSKHIISSSPMVLTHMVGIILFKYNLKVLEIALASGILSKSQLKITDSILSDIGNNLPLLSWAKKGDIGELKISMSNIPFYQPVEHILLKMFSIEAVISNGKSSKINTKWQPSFKYNIKAFLIRPMCWRYLLAPRLAMIQHFKFFDRIIASLEKSETEFIEKEVDNKRSFDFVEEAETRKYVHINPISAIIIPNYPAVLGRKKQLLANVRLLNLATLIWLYYIEHHRFPESLEEIGGKVIIDPYEQKLWNYSSARDSVVIKYTFPVGVSRPEEKLLILKKSNVKQYRINQKNRMKKIERFNN